MRSPAAAAPKADGDAVRSQAFLGEDWAQHTPLFAPLDLVFDRLLAALEELGLVRKVSTTAPVFSVGRTH